MFWGIIRWVCHLPWGYYYSVGYDHWSLVEDNADLLLQPPFGQKVLVAETLAGPWAMFAFWWNFLMWLPNMALDGGPLLFLLGVVDGVIAILLLVTTILQTSYIGLTRRQCATLSPGRDADASLLFFERVATINSTNPTFAKDLCNDYVGAWGAGIALFFLYGILASANIGFGRMSSMEYMPLLDRFYERPRSWKTTLLSIPGKVVFGTHNTFMMLLPSFIRRQVHFGERYCMKYGRHAIINVLHIIHQKMLRKPPEPDIAFDELTCGCEGGERRNCWACATPVCNYDSSAPARGSATGRLCLTIWIYAKRTARPVSGIAYHTIRTLMAVIVVMAATLVHQALDNPSWPMIAIYVATATCWKQKASMKCAPSVIERLTVG